MQLQYNDNTYRINYTNMVILVNDNDLKEKGNVQLELLPCNI